MIRQTGKLMADDQESLAHLMLTLVVFVGGRRGGRDGMEMLFVEILKGSSKVKIPGKLGGVGIPDREWAPTRGRRRRRW
jgi:hypothetical protein